MITAEMEYCSRTSKSTQNYKMALSHLGTFVVRALCHVHQGVHQGVSKRSYIFCKGLLSLHGHIYLNINCVVRLLHLFVCCLIYFPELHR